MNRIITTGITEPTAIQPFTSKSLNFLQDGIQEVFISSFLGLYAPNHSAISPLNLSITQSGNLINSGYFFGGGFLPEVFYCAGADITGYSNPPLCIPDFSWNTTGATFPLLAVADPITFTDNVQRNVHSVRRYRVVDQAAGVTGGFLLSVISGQSIAAQTGTLATSGAWTGTCSYMLDNKTGVMHLKGILSILGSGSIASLPAGFRPTLTKNINVNFWDDGNYISGKLTIDTAGVITPSANFAGSTIRGLFLDGISFYKGW